VRFGNSIDAYTPPRLLWVCLRTATAFVLSAWLQVALFVCRSLSAAGRTRRLRAERKILLSNGAHLRPRECLSLTVMAFISFSAIIFCARFYPEQLCLPEIDTFIFCTNQPSIEEALLLKCPCFSLIKQFLSTSIINMCGKNIIIFSIAGLENGFLRWAKLM
jgi:hypothetical protein